MGHLTNQHLFSCRRTSFSSAATNQKGLLSLQDLYTLNIASDPTATVFEGFDVDLDSRLASVTGNVDL